MDKFWMVWNPLRNAPMAKHSSQFIARQEAARLARKERGERFFVLEATHCVESNDVIETELAAGPF